VLQTVRAEDEIGKSFVDENQLASAASLGQVDRCGRVFWQGTFVAGEGEIEKQDGRRVAAWRPALGRVNEARAAEKIVGKLPRMLEKHVGLDLDDPDLRGVRAASKHGTDSSRARFHFCSSMLGN
jgi:hypothetical protein